MTFKTVIRLGAMCLVLAGCTKFCGISRKDMTPEQVVESYLNVAFNMTTPTERSKLASLASGKLRQAIESAPDETIQAAYIDRKYTIKSYAIIERRDRTPRETEITFRLVYADLGTKSTPIDQETAAEVTTDNTVSVIRDKGIWTIQDVIGSKTAIDFPLSSDNKIEAKPGVISSDMPMDDPSLDNPSPEDQ